MEMSGWARPGNLWARRAPRGRAGCRISQVCVDWMRCLLGKVTKRPSGVGTSLMHGLVMARKCPVQPESAMALLVGGVQLGGVMIGLLVVTLLV